MVTPHLFAAYPTPYDLAVAEPAEAEATPAGESGDDTE